MERASDQRFGVTRLRWRMRGAWQWPTFAAAIVADTLLLHLLPIAGNGTDLAAAALLALLFNIVVVAALAPLTGALLRHLRRDLPRIVARDYAGTTLVVATTALIALLGILHQPTIKAHERTFATLSAAVRNYVDAYAPAPVLRNIDRADVLQIDATLYRACVPGPQGAAGSTGPVSNVTRPSPRNWCILIDARGTRPQIRRDPSSSPNSTLGHPIG